MIPQWLRKRLAGKGRGARGGTCPRCKCYVITGLDHDDCALPAVVDDTEINHMSELLARLRGVATFDFTQYGGTWELRYRYPVHIKAEREFPVLVAHVCGIRWPATAEPHLSLTRSAPPATTLESPPF